MNRVSKASEILLLIGASIVRRRQELQLSQEELAERAGVHRTYISDLERGMRNVSILTLQRVAEALELPLTVLLMFGSGDTAPKPKKRGRN